MTLVGATLRVAWFHLVRRGWVGALFVVVGPLLVVGGITAQRSTVAATLDALFETRVRVEVSDPGLRELLEGLVLGDELGIAFTEPAPWTPGEVRLVVPPTVVEDGRFTVEGETLTAEAVRLAMVEWILHQRTDARLGVAPPVVLVVDGEPAGEASDSPVPVGLDPAWWVGMAAFGSASLWGLGLGVRGGISARKGIGSMLALIVPRRAALVGELLAFAAADLLMRGLIVAGVGVIWGFGGLTAEGLASSVALGLGLCVCAIAAGGGLGLVAFATIEVVPPAFRTALAGVAQVVATLALFVPTGAFAPFPLAGLFAVWTWFLDGDPRWLPALAWQVLCAGILLEAGIRVTLWNEAPLDLLSRRSLR